MSKSPRNEPTPDPIDLGQELRRLREEVAQLGLALKLQGGIANPSAAPISLRVFFARQASERKPFRLHIEGAVHFSEGLSAIRAAIFLVLLLDLRDRSEGGRGAADPTSECIKVAQQLEPQSVSKDPANVMRVALYRLFDYFESENPLHGTEAKLGFNVENLRLIPLTPGGESLSRPLDIHMSSNDPLLEQILSSAFHSSPLAIVKRRKSLYLPPGPNGSDRLLLEMYNHPYKLRVSSLYVRPPFQSYPENLLQLIGTSERTIERKRIAFEGYRSGRFHFLEILPKSVIWNLIRVEKGNRFRLYPPQVKKAHVLDHLDNLIYILRNFENYEFYVTDATIPFACVTYEIQSGIVPECYSVFFQSFDAADERDLGCFALNDPHVFQSISDHIVQWVVSHQSTIRERADVVKFLQKVRAHLDKRGPLKPEQANPS